MTAPREGFYCDSWNSETREGYIQLPADEKSNFEQWLQGIVSAETMRHSLMRYYPMLYDHIPSQKLSHLWLYARLLNMAKSVRDEFYEAGLIPDAGSIAYREVFLQLRARYSLSNEQNIASTMATHFPDRMPKSKGVWRVHNDHGGTPGDTEISSKFHIFGILMQKVSGCPIHLCNGLPTIPAETPLRRLIVELVTFEIQLRRFNLQFADCNVHNFLVEFNESTGAFGLTFVDFGAIFITSPDSLENSPITVSLPYSCNHERQILPQSFYQNAFWDEKSFVHSIIKVYIGTTRMASDFVNHLMPQLFRPHHQMIDEFAWQTIMLHINYSYNPTDTLLYGSKIYQALRMAERIMEQEISQKEVVPWWIRAICRMKQVMNAHADADITLGRIMNVLDSEQDECRHLCLLLVHCLLSTQCTDIQPGLMFHNACVLEDDQPLENLDSLCPGSYCDGWRHYNAQLAERQPEMRLKYSSPKYGVICSMNYPDPKLNSTEIERDNPKDE